jgi:Arc/MetJ family transcription regulator
MRTTITLDDDLTANLIKATGEKSAVDAIRKALQDYLRMSRKQRVLALRGQVQVEDNWRQLRTLDTHA